MGVTLEGQEGQRGKTSCTERTTQQEEDADWDHMPYTILLSVATVQDKHLAKNRSLTARKQRKCTVLQCLAEVNLSAEAILVGLQKHGAVAVIVSNIVNQLCPAQASGA